jgi:uncharacterized protein
MLLLLSPAKSLDFSPVALTNYTTPRLLSESQLLINSLRRKSAADLQNLMSVSEKIALLNEQRFQQFNLPFTPDNAKAAVLAFTGDVYQGLEAAIFSDTALEFAQQHLRILSGLYGVLRPLDLMQPYRLEMGTKLGNVRGKNLYEFWGERITQLIQQDLEEQGGTVVVNLASKEYFKAVKPQQLRARLIDIEFLEEKNGTFKIISFFAKKARGLMAKFVVNHQITDPEMLKGFDTDGYLFDAQRSKKDYWVFTR